MNKKYLITKASTSESLLKKGFPSCCWCWMKAAISELNDDEELLLDERFNVEVASSHFSNNKAVGK